MPDRSPALSLGPVLFNWKPEAWRDFYFRIADEAPVATVYLGEVVCAKRFPLFEPYFDAAAERLKAAGKQVVFATLAEVFVKYDRALVERICAIENALVEANDGSALRHLRGRPHHVGPFVNVYNEHSAAYLARAGARNFCLPFEMPAAAIRALCAATRDLDATIEVQVFGRTPLALSARCYHARAHGRSKDSCQFVCEEDPDGLVIKTLDDQPFLAVNGVQTLAYSYLSLIGQAGELQEMGVSRFRLSPHACDMVAVAAAFRAVLDGRIDADEGTSRLAELRLDAPFANGLYYRQPGHGRTGATTASGCGARAAPPA